MIEKPKRKKHWRNGAYRDVRTEFLAEQINDEGYYICAVCGRWLAGDEVEVDHIIKRSVAPERRKDKANLQVLCHLCHLKKDSGRVFK